MFCASSKLDPFEPSVVQALTWLTQRYEDGASYGTLNTGKAVLGLLIGEEVSKSPVISRFFKGVYRSRPPKPRYDDTWDVAPVLSRISKMFPLDTLSLPELTEKLVMLLALATAHRMQSLTLIKITNITRNEEGYSVKIPELIKSSRLGAPQPLFHLPRFKNKPELCVASTLECYLDRTRDLRGEVENLVLTTRKPHSAAATDSMARWIKSFLVKSGINNKYKAHSTRHAVTSAALKKGVDINIIKSTAGWSKESLVFAKFYNRPLNQDRRMFAKTILENNDV